MKNIKIFLQSPWRKTDSPYYKYLRKMPPMGIEYVNAKDFELIHNKSQLKFNNWLKKFAKNLIRKIYPSMPNAHYTLNAENYDLIHCAHCISKNKRPWICDIEFVGQFWAGTPHDNFPPKKKVLKYLESSNCKKILAWSKWSKDGILKNFPEVKNKVEILYPAIPCQNVKKSFNKIGLLFTGRDFYMKGGEIVLKIFDKMTRKYKNVSATVVSDVPENVLEKYKSNDKIKFYNLMSQKKLFNEIYPNANIFLYPTFSDTFGFAILEAQSFGLPVIAMKTRSTHTINETITDGKTGFIIDNLKANAYEKIFSDDIIKKIENRVEKLIKNKDLLKKMSKNCFKEVKYGKFSINERNKKLKVIYNYAATH